MKFIKKTSEFLDASENIEMQDAENEETVRQLKERLILQNKEIEKLNKETERLKNIKK